MTQYYSKFTTVTIEWQTHWPVNSICQGLYSVDYNYTAFQCLLKVILLHATQAEFN